MSFLGNEIASPTQREKLVYLDGLRGLAALSVFLYHFFSMFYPVMVDGSGALPAGAFQHAIYRSGATFFFEGNFAVCIFFVLSGYVLTRDYYLLRSYLILLRRAAGRYFRLVPVVAVSVFAAAILIELGAYEIKEATLVTGAGHRVDHQAMFSFTVTTVGCVKNALFTNIFINNPEEKLYNPVLWSIPIEFRGSFIAFSCAFLTCKMPFRFITLNTLGYLLYALIGVPGMYFWPFLMGVAFASLKAAPQSPKALVFLALFVGLYLGGDNGNPEYSVIDHYISFVFPVRPHQVAHMWGAGLLLFAVLSLKPLQKFLSHRIFAFLGKVSFCFYAMHQMIIYSVGTQWMLFFYDTLPYDLSMAILFIVLLVSSLVIAYFMTEFIDRPAIAFAHKVSNWVVPRKTPGNPQQRVVPGEPSASSISL